MDNSENLKKNKRLCSIMMVVFCSLFVISIVIQWITKWSTMNLPTIFFGGMAFICIIVRLLANKNIIVGN